MYSYYVVKSGDTLESIASRFNTTVYQLRIINNLSNNKVLRPGEVITVPISRPLVQDELGSIPVENTNFFTKYVVQRGDNLYNIAQRYNISVQDLMLLNSISSNSFLQPGQVLIVPQPYIHIFLTKTGDSIESILREKGINADNLLNYNNNIYLLPNQLLIYRDSKM